jgi:hypothetical protein
MGGKARPAAASSNRSPAVAMFRNGCRLKVLSDGAVSYLGSQSHLRFRHVLLLGLRDLGHGCFREQ